MILHPLTGVKIGERAGRKKGNPHDGFFRAMKKSGQSEIMRRGINQMVYDVTSKRSGKIEWE
jgi:hypothetical protein